MVLRIIMHRIWAIQCLELAVVQLQDFLYSAESLDRRIWLVLRDTSRGFLAYTRASMSCRKAFHNTAAAVIIKCVLAPELFEAVDSAESKRSTRHIGTTAHRRYDWSWIVGHGPLVIDTRNRTAGSRQAPYG